MPQSFTCLHTHFIFSTKHRRPIIRPDFQERLYQYIGGIFASERARLIAAGGAADHVHLLASLHASTSVADIMRLVKTNSSKWVHDTIAQAGDFDWQDGYGAFAVSVSNRETVKKYIENQAEHHRTRSFEEEFVEFLERHEIPFDRRYLFA